MGDPYAAPEDEEAPSGQPNRRLFMLMAWLVPLQTAVLFTVIGFVFNDDLQGFPAWLWILFGMLLAAIELIVLLYVRRTLPPDDHTPGTFRL